MNVQEKLKIIRVPIPTPTLYPHTTTNGYLIGNQAESLLVDAGYDVEETKTILHQELEQHHLAVPKKIILTHAHPDHAPGVRQLKEWDAKIYCHRDEKADILKAIAPIKDVALLEDGDHIHIGGEIIEVLHTPGHTRGHLSLYLPSAQTLIAGDNIVDKGTTWIGPPDGDMTDYLATLERLKSLKLYQIGPGHGEWIVNPYEQIQFVLNRRLERESQIVALLTEHKQVTAEKLTEIIYENMIHPSIFNVANLTTIAHLQKLIVDGVAVFKEPYYSLVAS